MVSMVGFSLWDVWASVEVVKTYVYIYIYIYIRKVEYVDRIREVG